MAGQIAPASDPRRGEIWFVNLDPTIGSEIGKTRPCLVVQRDDWGRLPIRIVLPITDWKERYARYPWMVRVIPDAQNGLTKESAVDTLEVRSVSTRRMIRKIGEFPMFFVDEIANAAARCMGSIPRFS